MKIAILTPTFSHFSGIDRLVEMQAEEFISKGNKVDVFTLQAAMKPKKAGLVVIGMPNNHFLERLYRLFMFLDFSAVRRYSDILKDYDMVISHLYPMNILACAAKKKNRKLRYVYNNAGVGITDAYSFFERAYLRLFTFFNNRTIMDCDDVVSISDFLRKVLKKETGKYGKVKYIEIDKKRFHKGISGSKVRKRFKIKKGPVFLYVGRVSPHKGVHLLIKAFNIVRKRHPDAKLIIAGKHTFAGYSMRLKRMAGRDVIFAGFVKDEELPYYYAACDIYTTASLWEGFDMPILESYYVGKPSVAFDIGSHPEVIKKGILVKAKDVNGFADAIEKILAKRFKR